jgi:spermidine synthase
LFPHIALYDQEGQIMSATRLTDTLHDYYQISLLVEEMLADERTPYQHIQIAQTKFFGKALMLDGIIQLTERDNAAYHEMIVHVPLLAQDNPKQILIVGGGDGGSAQQVLRHPGIEKVVVCELDRRVVELCEEHFPAFGRPFGDPRVELVIQDAFQYLKETDRRFDVIIADTTDPVGEAEKLFSEEFYQLMAGALTPGGAITTQCEQMMFDGGLIRDMLEMGRGLAEHAAYYYACVPTYPGGTLGFLYLSDTHWEQGFGKPLPDGLDYLNHEMQQAAFALPEYLRRML